MGYPIHDDECYGGRNNTNAAAHDQEILLEYEEEEEDKNRAGTALAPNECAAVREMCRMCPRFDPPRARPVAAFLPLQSHGISLHAWKMRVRLLDGRVYDLKTPALPAWAREFIKL